MHQLDLKLDNLNTNYGLSKIAAKSTEFYIEHKAIITEFPYKVTI